MTEYLQNYAGIDSGKDREFSGAIKALQDVLNISLDEVKES
jgi:hypothetical protein